MMYEVGIVQAACLYLQPPIQNFFREETMITDVVLLVEEERDVALARQSSSVKMEIFEEIPLALQESSYTLHGWARKR